MIIYVITNLLNGKKYVGQTTRTLEERFSEHKFCKDSYIGKAIRKYGEENFKAEVLEECSTLEELNEREKYWIAKLNTLVPNGYNLNGGGSNAIPTETTRKKQSDSANKRFENPDERNKISKTLTGRKISESKKQYFSDPNNRKKHSEAAKNRKNK